MSMEAKGFISLPFQIGQLYEKAGVSVVAGLAANTLPGTVFVSSYIKNISPKARTNNHRELQHGYLYRGRRRKLGNGRREWWPSRGSSGTMCYCWFSQALANEPNACSSQAVSRRNSFRGDSRRLGQQISGAGGKWNCRYSLSDSLQHKNGTPVKLVYTALKGYEGCQVFTSTTNVICTHREKSRFWQY